MAADNIQYKIVDTSLDGGAAFGKMNVLTSSNALRNSIKMWLASFKGDYIGSPNKGGIVTSLIARPMRPEMVPIIRQAITDGLQFDYAGQEIQVLSLNVEGDFENRRWIISLEVYSPRLKLQTTVNESLRGA